MSGVIDKRFMALCEVYAQIYNIGFGVSHELDEAVQNARTQSLVSVRRYMDEVLGFHRARDLTIAYMPVILKAEMVYNTVTGGN